MICLFLAAMVENLAVWPKSSTWYIYRNLQIYFCLSGPKTNISRGNICLSTALALLWRTYSSKKTNICLRNHSISGPDFRWPATYGSRKRNLRVCNTSCQRHLFKANLIAMSSAAPPTNGQNASKAKPRWLTENLRNTAKILSCMKAVIATQCMINCSTTPWAEQKAVGRQASGWRTLTMEQV